MLRKFKISIDGTQYLVEMEEVGTPTPTPADVASALQAAPAPATQPAAQAAPAPAPAPVATPAPQPAAPVSDSAPEGAHVQEAPMPGKILEIHVNVGDAVTINQPVMVLEAMKMESEIVAEKDGVIASINVAPGQSVNPGDLLFSIE